MDCICHGVRCDSISNMIISLIYFLRAHLQQRKPNWEEDEDYGSRGSGILGRALPS